MNIPGIRMGTEYVTKSAQAVASGTVAQAGGTSHLKTKGQARQAIDHLLSSFGMKGSLLHTARKTKIITQLGLNGPANGPVSKRAQNFLGMLGRLNKNATASGPQKQHFAETWLATRDKHGARKALEGLASNGQFFRAMDDTQRALVASKLGQQGSPAAVKSL